MPASAEPEALSHQIAIKESQIIMTCKHQPTFSFKLLFGRKPSYVCKECGEDIEMTPKTKSFSQAINAVIVVALVFTAFRGSSGLTGQAATNAMIQQFSIMGGLVLVYLLVQYLLLRFGGFQEKAPDTSAQGPDTGASSDAGTEVKPDYTQEQLELMALYDSYVKKNQDEEDAVRAESGDSASQEMPAGQAMEELDACVHKPSASWKNYIPGKFEFVCGSCGKTIEFIPSQKRLLNIILLVVSFGIVMPAFMSTTLPFWVFMILVFVALIVGTVIQILYVKKGSFALKPKSGK